jgi:hypothetical protein
MKALADNDIILKAACYGLLPAILAPVGDGTNGNVGFLGAAQFVLGKQLSKIRLRGNVARIKETLSKFFSANEVLEPTREEQALAADLEALAQAQGVNLDTGESQLVSILISRSLLWLLTGDKRAVVAIERLLDEEPSLHAIKGKVMSLEQLVSSLLTSGDGEMIRAAICAEPDVDRSLKICFACASAGVALSTVMEGLKSYIGDLRKMAPRVLST